MHIDFDNDCIDVSVSLQSFDSKPNTYYGLTYEQKSITINQFLDLITAGHCFCYNFHTSKRIFGLNEKTIANFSSTSIIWIDIDDSEDNITTVCNKLRYKPNIAYTTFSNGIKGNRFRFIYLLDFNIYNIDEYQDYIHVIYSSIKVDIDNNLFIDEKCLNVSQQFLGTNKDSIILLNNEYYYSIKLLDKIKLEYICTKNNDSNNIIYKEKRERIITENHKIGTDKNEIINKALDIYNSEDFKPILTNADNVIHGNDVYTYVGDKNVYEIRRWYNYNTMSYCRINQGYRNTVLFTFGIIIRNIEADIKVERLAATLYWIYNNYCEVTDDMSIIDIVNIAIGCMNYNNPDLGKKKYQINPLYKDSLSRIQKLQALSEAKCKRRNELVMNNYDSTKTVKENAAAIGLSPDTVRKALNDSGYSIRRTKFERFKECYKKDSNKSIRELSAELKISKTTIQKYIKELRNVS